MLDCKVTQHDSDDAFQPSNLYYCYVLTRQKVVCSSIGGDNAFDHVAILQSDYLAAGTC